MNEPITQVLTDKGSPLILQGECRAKGFFEIEEYINDINKSNKNNESNINKSSLDEEYPTTIQPIATLASNDDRLVYEALEKSKEEKQITEIYFSYGDDEIRLNDTSKHYKDINLHIITRNCRDNEEIEIVLESSNHQNFTAYGRVKDNKAVIKNIFKDI